MAYDALDNETKECIQSSLFFGLELAANWEQR
jgi:hypothetical protein